MQTSRKQRRAAKAQARKQNRTLRKGSVWPDFCLAPDGADPRFVEEVKKAIHVFRFDELDDFPRNAYRLMKRCGATNTFNTILKAQSNLREDGVDTPTVKFADIFWHLFLGEAILEKIPKPVREELLPYNDVRFLPIGNIILVQCRSLTRLEGSGKPFWYSRNRPQLIVDGSPYTVAFSQHAIDQIKVRINPRWMSYAGLGDVFAFLEECIYFEVCHLRNRTQDGQLQLAVSFFNYCDDERYWSGRYIEEMIGQDKLDLSLGKPFYRVGYCPAYLDGGYIKLTTLLFPGYRQTPEYGLLLDSPLAEETKSFYQKIAQEQNAVSLLETNDFSALKWFHENGIPQVVQMKEEVYRPYASNKFVVREVIPGR